MAYEDVLSLDADTIIALGGVDKKTGKPNPTQVEGFYLGAGKRQTNSRFSKGPSTVYFFQTPKGNVGVWSKTYLDKKMPNCVLGAMTKVIYDGMKTLPNGSDWHTYLIKQDKNVSIDVSSLSAEATAPAINYAAEGAHEQLSDAYADETEELDTEDDEETYEAPPVAAAVQQESAAARKAKVQEMLKRGNKTK